MRNEAWVRWTMRALVVQLNEDGSRAGKIHTGSWTSRKKETKRWISRANVGVDDYRAHCASKENWKC